uniref:MPN domain-containing protein n=1 Tax=Grammatophora oceanica TaxID=210454 RepID=A0A7S1UX41_9STRA|mmetsp:Transcript_27715/g.40764  ORF Transcript_27715/g.40764 Transcript_27715/m.40764 type:complete len:347 (+) Transcript_27715:101-1141(+)|eukprot:CAMPEP_0194040658 /NCGR_PEP_ID=MMETSP0009_2-20130614/12620_1 /TAXON_ID=210454 /ORGANISM="Grammatophora oceanica, Strain CCMP 410" /LENGTH=346 /DNA_ID=CAMNT_0038683857 /DNA_START=46 /DNA_END=1086 /DNA_ORIENTATION=+
MSEETKEVDKETSTTTVSTAPRDVEDVTVHPLVLLSAADHYHRVARGTRKRVVGILLGTVIRGKVDATNSFAVPFEEDNKNPAVFYLDHNYLENMLRMFRKVNAKERVVGFYSTGPQIRPNDLRILDIVQRFVNGPIPPVFCIIDIRPDRQSIPTTAYKVVEEVDSSNQRAHQVKKSFAHVPSMIDAQEAEEVGVEHLLRDINDPTVSTVASLIKAKMAGLSTLTEKLVECKDYLESCVRDERKVNQEIIANMQTILNLLPNLNTDEMVEAMLIKTNDMQMAIYLSALIRSVIALHDLVVNKITYNEEVGNITKELQQTSTSSEPKVEEEKKDEKGDKPTAASDKK